MMVYLLMFLEFFKTGLFAIGGGLATLPFLYDLADKYEWFTRADVTNMIAVSESTPGPIGINMATFAGYNVAGLPGAAVAVFGLVLPSYLIIVIIAKYYMAFSQNSLVQTVFSTIRPAVTGLIAAAGFSVATVSVLTLDAFRVSGQLADLLDVKSLLLFAVIFAAQRKLDWHPAVYLLIAAVVGIIFKF